MENEKKEKRRLDRSKGPSHETSKDYTLED